MPEERDKGMRGKRAAGTKRNRDGIERDGEAGGTGKYVSNAVEIFY